MAQLKKLQSEIDKGLKKVDEGPLLLGSWDKDDGPDMTGMEWNCLHIFHAQLQEHVEC